MNVLFFLNPLPMRKIYLKSVLAHSIVLMTSGIFSAAQCPAGYTTAQLNWDNLDYLSRVGSYSTFVTNAMMYTQNFTIGTNRLTINFPGTITTAGENLVHGGAGETGSFGAGADVQYNGNGAITITFDQAVYNLQFSLYDIDSAQTVAITAVDVASAALQVNLANPTPGIITISNNNTTTPTVTTVGTCTNTDSRGTLNVTISGNLPAGVVGVKTVTINIGGRSGAFWLSDIRACVQGTFPTNYYIAQRPWNGQPSYYLVTPDNNSVYMMNPLTGQCYWLFSEPASPWLNSLAYDHVNKILYYVMDNPSPVASNRSLKKYDFNTETISTVIADLSTLGIPLYEIVVESSGAAFYNWSLYLGIEGTNSSKTSSRESIIWRIDFNAFGVPYQAAQTFARPADNGTGTLTHDWGDFTIKDGTLYDFNTGNVGSTAQYLHFNMQTGIETIFAPAAGNAPIQAGQTWDGRIFWTGGQSNIPGETGRVAPYLENGLIGPKISATVVNCGPSWAGRAGDASDPFKPKSDFGDAPASYDPVPDDKATHEYDCDLRLGATFDREWDKTSSLNATADGTDEDGITTVSLLTSGISNYTQDVRVYNNTGSNATLAAWLDFNGNGVYDPVEGKTLNIPTNASIQTVTVTWIGIPVAILPGNNTFMRIRVTSASNGMTVSTPNRWFNDGEVEDYLVPIDIILPVKMLSFTAEKKGESVLLKWITSNEVNLSGFEIERSHNGSDWKALDFVPAFSDNSPENNYQYYDNDPLQGRSYYRLKLQFTDGKFEYSETRVIDIHSRNTWMKLSPNPAKDQTSLEFSMESAGAVTIRVTAASGAILVNKGYAAGKGINQFNLNDLNRFGAGIYIVQVITSNDVMSNKLIINK